MTIQKAKRTRRVPTKKNRIKSGRFEFRKVEELLEHPSNRDLVGLEDSDKSSPDFNANKSSHVRTMKVKLDAHGWLGPVSVTSGGVILEGQHRVHAARELGETMVPVYVVDWINEDDVDDVRQVIITLNNDNRPWTLWNYLKTYKNDNTRKEYQKLYSVVQAYSETLTPGILYTTYTGESSVNKKTRSGGMKFPNEKFSDYLVRELRELVMTYGKKKLPAQPLRSFAKLALDEEDKGVVEHVIFQIRERLDSGGSVPEGDVQFSQWFDKIVEKYNKIYAKGSTDEILQSANLEIFTQP